MCEAEAIVPEAEEHRSIRLDNGQVNGITPTLYPRRLPSRMRRCGPTLDGEQ